MRIIRVVVVAASLVALVSIDAAAQQRRISGRVAATGTNEPLASATVLVAGTPLGTHTNDEGRFELLVPDADVQLVARRIGFKQTSVRVPRTRSDVTLSLDRDVLMLEEQVITGENTSVARRNAANDVATVSSVELTRAPTPTIENALAGKVAGATVQQNSGAPGGGLQVQLRGVTTINAATDPLYIVDGVIVSNDAIASGANAITAAAAGGNASPRDNAVNRIADINPADIERIEVLKGASASAIYGSKASNGVIVITTTAIALDELLKQKRYSLLWESGSRWIDARLYGRLATLPLDQPTHKVIPNFPIPTPERDARGGNVTCQ